ncbi:MULTISPECIES: hypothetical protein [Parachlamydia]|jgi:hypothetical protein|uniref:Uncharacterized protein n=2 Tax=Parachlamydia acanthamoebae TaxID=83552 RepID=F8KWR1_PARAV|nr:hypothetical protein [Parachlamydia acanthamoebae]EFB42310.1 hypothetical protein pah_c012o022 [Parachlamydia acanthamoebae str. Hall's coccus]CCB86094.1 putative uncharacterized protein [Parachlamydia acanthamoebae UV-7]
MSRFVYFLALLCVIFSYTEAGIYLRDNLKNAEAGDFIVTMQNKTCSLLHIYSKEGQYLTIEEISLPASKTKSMDSWRAWVQEGAPGHTSWTMYSVNLMNGAIDRCFSFTKNRWCDPTPTENFLGTLLNLHLNLVSTHERKKIGGYAIGTPGPRRIWEPRLIVDGNVITGVSFDAWRTHWPKDGSILSGKTIEVYVPSENTPYPSYFPYWLEISGMMGQAKLRVVDSGKGLRSPKPSLFQLEAAL